MEFNRNTMAALFIGLALGAVLTVVGLTLANRVQPAPIVIVPPEPTMTPVPSATPGPIRVFVNGHVAQPAVYDLPPGLRVEDAITAAGGFLADADTAVVNLAFPLSDGIQVYVPGIADEAAPPQIITNPVLVSAPADQPAGNSGLVNINTATLEELDALPGIGPSTAQKILDYRDENGRFATIEEIMNVSGIGEAKFSRVKDLITIGEQP